MKKKICFAILFLIVVAVVFFLIKGNNKNEYNKDAFYLDSEYYNKGEFISLNADEVTNLLNNKKTFILFTYNNYCNLPISCDTIFQKMMDNNKIDIAEITFEEFKHTSLYETVKLAPSIIIIQNGEIINYLKADKDEDLSKYQDVLDFTNWIKEYVILEKKD